MAAAHDRLGWHWWPGSNAIATEDYRNQGACVQRGACMWGCVNKAKASPDVTHWPDLLKQGVRLITRATASEIETDARGLATAVVYVDAEGVTRRQEADVVVVAANGLGTPRLLQLVDQQAISRRSRQFVGAGRQAAHDASVRRSRRGLRRAARSVEERLGSADLLARVLRDRQEPRLRPRCQVERHPDRRTAGDDGRVPVGRQRHLGRALPRHGEGTARSLRRVGHRRRRPPRRAQSGRARSLASSIAPVCPACAWSTALLRTRRICSRSTSSERPNRSARRERRRPSSRR